MSVFTRKRVLLLCGLIVVGGGSLGAYLRHKPAPVAESVKYRTALTDTGDITQTVTANGTINPVALINVGSQVSGTVNELKADFNDRVKKGQVLLKLDPTIFDAQIRQAEATLASASASLRLAQATHERNENLVAKSYVSSLALDQSRREVDVAQANVKLAQAQLARAEADLNNSVIRAPIDGVIIRRTIDLGQTLAASFATPNLFQIAQDLTKMQIDTNVSEADIGALQVGQSARFVVDAYPNREFEARMRQFRLAANVVQNVVTYNVVLDVDNKDELLKPGMTAQVRLVVGARKNVLRIPTAALRFKMSDEEMAKLSKKTPAVTTVSVTEAPSDDVSFRSKSDISRSFKIFKLDRDNQAVPIDIRVGLSNFRYTEVLGGALKAGEKVITRSLATAADNL